MIARGILKEIGERLQFMIDVGLEYLTIDRAANTLSGGESQRIRLATQIGSKLMGVLYILDEPSIGLHQRDNRRLINTLVRLRDLGNTLIVVEHDKAIDIDQSPIGRTPRSNPATYTGMFTYMRELFASLPEAKMRGYGPGRFSFNVRGGRCEACQGDGIIQIEMHFLPDVYVPCEVCHGTRYSREVQEVKFRGHSISDVLELTVDEALEVFENVPRIRVKLRTLHDVGLGYIRLGQPATQLSGGEAQRVKLSAELSRRDTGRTLYLLDEPTTGLHYADVERLLQVLHRLVDHGNTVVVIEHNLDVLKTADWLIDLGPEGGEKGGYVIAEGTPEQLANNRDSATGQYLGAPLAKARKTPVSANGAGRSRRARVAVG